jgi:uncharacterized protein GlcG (DUF336 family)
MRTRFLAFGFAVAALLAGAASTALPQELLTQKVMSLALAEEIAHAAMDKCRADGYPAAISVVDANGDFKVFLRDDKVKAISIDISRRKALTAASYGRTSADVGKGWKANGEPLVKAPDALPAGGGVPIKAGNEVIGGVGVVGAPGGDKDEACALAGVAKVADKLK